ncbi:hypothetical protein LU276_06610 [Moraxella haemolytica]|uniref:hypothetical protein n=1 Tax=Moraxella haemolytica TaxID=2904119 RepID=UPI002543187D|nr:hypothetical protein [Moraxella sp. ZY171148]WII94696.1 hypothetical protein LU276_06610 [Moraxella sp. ZY171148]
MTDRLDKLLKKQLHPEEIARQKQMEDTLKLIAKADKCLQDGWKKRQLWAEQSAKRAKKRSTFSLLKVLGISAIVYTLFF